VPSAANSARPVGRVLTILPSARRNCRSVPILPKSTLRGCSLDLCYLGFLSSPPSFSQICTVANQQGSVIRESATALAERATAQLTTRFSASETDVLGEGELKNRCALHLFVFENTRGNPRVRKRKRPVTPCVPGRGWASELRYLFFASAQICD
jgi:hypothetical protein